MFVVENKFFFAVQNYSIVFWSRTQRSISMRNQARFPLTFGSIFLSFDFNQDKSCLFFYCFFICPLHSSSVRPLAAGKSTAVFFGSVCHQWKGAGWVTLKENYKHRGAFRPGQAGGCTHSALCRPGRGWFRFRPWVYLLTAL